MANTQINQNSSRVERLRVLGVAVDELRNSEAWQRWLATAAKFHKYSASNSMLISVQFPEASQVAGYRQWQALGRQVKKGEKGIVIMAPRFRRDPDDPDEKVLTGFGTARVFDISQTEGEPIKPEWPLISHEFAEADLTQIIAQAELAGIKIDFTEEQRKARGWYVPSTKTVTLRADLPLGQQAKTLLHELAHAFDPELDAGCAGASEEIVAESVSWLLSTRFGLEADPVSTHYLASWSGGTNELMGLADRIIKTAKLVETEVLDLEPWELMVTVA